MDRIMKTITIEVPDNCEVQIVEKEEKKEPVIRTYQDLIDNNIILDNSYWISEDSVICSTSHYPITDNSDKNVATSEKIVKSMLAMAMISQLMPYYGGFITNEEWEDNNIDKYTIVRKNNYIYNLTYSSFYQFLAFHTAEQRDDFLKYNEKLVKDYLMID